MEWFISKDGKQENGFDTQQLRNMIENGELLNSDLAWKQGMEDWVMIRDVPELSSPPPLPQTEGQTQSGDAPPPLHATGSHGTEIIYAGFLKRMAALFLDGIVLTIFSIPIYLISGLVSMAGNKESSTFIHFLLVVILSATYFTRMESSESSATYGKRWMGLKALDADGQRLSTANAFARWALHILSYITLYIGFFIQPFTARRQALHDIIANTIVVERTENKPSPFFVKWMIGVSSFLVALTIVGVIAAIAIPAYQNYKLKHSIVDPFSDPKLGGEKETRENLTDADVGLDNPALNNAIDVYEKGDFIQAFELFRSLAEQGDQVAQYNLGVMYDRGEGVTQDYKQTVDWFTKSAEQGFSIAQFNLGVMYDRGRGVTQDYQQAIDWYRKAAEQGLAGAQKNLGTMYEEEKGAIQDYKQAADWYRKAAEQGLAGAQFRLGFMYEKGQGVIQDYKQAADWYRKAAEQGHAGAQINLGIIYAKGQGVVQNYILAHMWCNLASTKGLSEAIENRDIIATEMTRGQIAEAQKLAKECEQRNYKSCD